MVEVNIFRNTFDKDCTKVFPIVKILAAIKKGKWENLILEIRNTYQKSEVKRLKELLPAVTFSGIFDERKDDACVYYSHLMTVDIDKLKYSQVVILKEKLRKNKYVFAFFESPSKGLKVLIPVDSPPEKHKTDAFETVESMFKEMYGVEIDPSGKNLSRLCYVSYDPDLYYNPDCDVLHIEEILRLDEFEKIVGEAKGFIPVYDASKIFETCIKMVKASKVGSYKKGNRNNYLFSLACLMNEFGVPETQTLHFIFSRYTSLEFKEITSTVRSAFRKTKSTQGTKSLRGSTNNQTNLLE
jgi:hypothetical protein